MSDSDENCTNLYERYLEERSKFKGTDDFMEHLTQCADREEPYLAIEILIGVYAIDQFIGGRIHNAYREAVVAATNGEGNVDEMIAEIESTEAVLPAYDKELQSDYVLLKSFSEETKKTTDLMVSLLQTNREIGRRIYFASNVVMRRTYFSTKHHSEDEFNASDSDESSDSDE